MRVSWIILIIGGLLSLLCSVALTLFPMHPEEVGSQAALWLVHAGLSSWADGLTETTDRWVIIGLWTLLAVAIGLLGFGLVRMFCGGRKDKTKEAPPFDTPIREAVDHYVRTFTHSFQNGADRHAFEVLHKAMCKGNLPVVGTRGEDSRSECISAQRCKQLKPTMVVVPRNWASPRGVRFDLMDEAGTIAPLVESDSFPGYTGLRVRRADLYRLWPKNRVEKAG